MYQPQTLILPPIEMLKSGELKKNLLMKGFLSRGLVAFLSIQSVIDRILAAT